MRKTVLVSSSRLALLALMLCSTIRIGTFSWCMASSVKVELFLQKPAYGSPTLRTDQCHCNGSQVDSRAPLDLICLCAKVTYNDEPVANAEVGFDVVGPANVYFNFTISRQAQTNASGVALASFRVPWPPEHGNETILGQWWATTKVCIANEESGDAHWWYVRFFGDFNGDGIVGPFDFARFSVAYGSAPEGSKWLPDADFDEDQRVGPYDFAFFSIEYGRHYP